MSTTTAAPLDGQYDDEPEYAYECPECGTGHDGDVTGTEYCRECTEDLAAQGEALIIRMIAAGFTEDAARAMVVVG